MRGGDISQVADFVGQLDQLGSAADVGSVLNLEAFSLGLWQRFVVGYLEDDGGDFLAKETDELLFGRFGVLNCVVQNGGNQDALVLDASFVREDVRKGDGVVDIWGGAGVLAALVAVFVGGEGDGCNRFIQLAPLLHPSLLLP